VAGGEISSFHIDFHSRLYSTLARTTVRVCDVENMQILSGKQPIAQGCNWRKMPTGRITECIRKAKIEI